MFFDIFHDFLLQLGRRASFKFKQIMKPSFVKETPRVARGFSIRERVCILLLGGGVRSLDAIGRVGCILTAEATIQVPFVEKTEPQPLSALGRAMCSGVWV